MKRAKRPAVTVRGMAKRERLLDDLIKMKEKAKLRQDLRRGAKDAETRRNREIEISALEGQLSTLRPGVARDVVEATLANKRKLLQEIKKK